MDTLQQAVELAEQNGNVDVKTVSAQTRIGAILHVLHRSEDALVYLEQALQSLQAAEAAGSARRDWLDRAELDASFHWNIAEICFDLNRFAVADKYLNQSLKNCQQYLQVAPNDVTLAGDWPPSMGFLANRTCCRAMRMNRWPVTTSA
ncbi:MAG: tetratricopeptide repeat protein [Fuerstiella sp.]